MTGKAVTLSYQPVPATLFTLQASVTPANSQFTGQFCRRSLSEPILHSNLTAYRYPWHYYLQFYQKRCTVKRAKYEGV